VLLHDADQGAVATRSTRPRRRHGAERVGLLTGDNSINGEAPVVVMTTEVLRNMLYAGSPRRPRGLGYVVMDEVHYLADRFRGAVWEEVIIHLPERCRSCRCRPR
jgi:ATP-dependent RNA helicase HelY